MNVRLGTLSPDITEPTPLLLADGSTLTLEPLQRTHNERRIGLPDFNPCTILLNNDLSDGIPPILEDLHEQTLLPPLHSGWAIRRKSNHFSAYDSVVRRFARLIDIDPWMLNPFFTKCDQINFMERSGEECLAESVNTVLTRIRRKYREYKIDQKPFVIVKADAGTYGMGIMTVSDASEIQGLNRKQRNKMATTKGGQPVKDVIVQEGIPSFERINDAVAEPVVYMIDRYVIGGFYRVHAERDNNENLNTPGAHFVPLAFSQQHAIPDFKAEPGTTAPNRFYMYGVVARLGLLAASMELEKTDPNPDF